MDFITQSPQNCSQLSVTTTFCSLLASTATAAATAGDYQAAVAASLPLV